MSDLEPEAPVDVDAVMAQIRARVAATGSAADSLFRPAPVGGTETIAEPQLERAENAAIIVPDLTVGRSTRPVIGGLIARVRGFVIRAGTGPASSLAAQQTRFNAEMIGYSRALGADLAELRRETAIGRPPSVQLVAVEARLARLEGLLEALTEKVGLDKHPNP